MISKRFPRHSSAQESLRQFALNCSKGIDETTPITDSDTVLYTKNLVRNPDGSLSIRKPIKQLPTPRVFEKIYPLHDPDYYLGVVKEPEEYKKHIVGIFNGADPVPIKIKTTDYLNKELSVDCELIDSAVFTEPEVLALNTTTVVGCLVDFGLLEELFKIDPGSILNPKLYGSDSAYYRYLQIRYDDTSGWEVVVKVPEVNVLNMSEGEVPLNPNLVLDNPYAIRDEYNVSVPSVKSIIAYVPTISPKSGPTYHDWGYEVNTVEVYEDTDLGGTLNDLKKYDGDINYYVDCDKNGHDDFVISFPYSDDGNYRRYSVSKKDIGGGKFEISLAGTINFLMFASATRPIIYNVTVELLTDVGVASGHPMRKVLSRTYDSSMGSEVSDTFNFDNVLLGTVGSEFEDSDRITLDLTVSGTVSMSNLEYPTVAELTESNKSVRFRPVSAFGAAAVHDPKFYAYLKAFSKIPQKELLPTGAKIYATWLKSFNGVTWSNVYTDHPYGIVVKELEYSKDPDDLDGDKDRKNVYAKHNYYPFTAVNERDSVRSEPNHRIDVLKIPEDFEGLKTVQYMFKIISVAEISKDDFEYDSSDTSTQYRVDFEYGRAVYTPVIKDEFEFLETELGNGAAGKKLYYKRSIYSYGDEKFENNIFATDVDSFITPLYNIIDVDTTATPKVTSLTPWRDYLISATDRSIHLHQKLSEGYTTKVLTTSVGIPEADSRCCVSVLNSIIFKSGSKIYRMYPGAYSSDDTVLNITDISAPIESILYDIGETENNFAFSTSTEYILMMPYESGTHCLRYEYADKVWTYCEYPVVFDNYRINSLDDIRIYGRGAYVGRSLLKKYAEFLFDYTPNVGEPYADFIELSGMPGTPPVPINFEYDTGQKTDSISRTKQFVESKLVFATLDEKDSFPFTLQVAIDGDPHVTTKDVSTDAPFWKTDNSIGVVGTAFRLTSNTEGAAGIFNTLRQLVVRYSGKGKSIRHRLTGDSICNFKLYETYVRYKNLSGK